jgi:anti-anti-sigma factor
MVEQRFHLVGNADVLAAPRITEELDKVVRACDSELVIDCTGLEFIDSSGIGVLVRARDDLDASGRRLRIVNMPQTGRRTIEAVGLSEYLGLDGNST